MRADLEVIIERNGTIRFVYDDLLADLYVAEHGLTTRRASHVEPAPAGSGWTVDLSPVDGPFAGPFARRADALAWEVDWLHKTLCDERGENE